MCKVNTSDLPYNNTNITNAYTHNKRHIRNRCLRCQCFLQYTPFGHHQHHRKAVPKMRSFYYANLLWPNDAFHVAVFNLSSYIVSGTWCGNRKSQSLIVVDDEINKLDLRFREIIFSVYIVCCE